MTLAETKASIVSQLNQQAVSALVDQLAQLAVKHEELEAKYAAITKPADRAEPLPV